MGTAMKLRFLMLIKVVMVPIGAIASCFRKKSPVVILMYHRVNDQVRKEISISKEAFRWQMKYLARKGYKVISLDQAIGLVRENTDPVSRGSRKRQLEKYVVLTFDDGYQDYYENATPILMAYSYPSIVYLVPGRIESGEVFWWDRDLGKSELMGWEEVLDLRRNPLVTFGSHTMTHADLDRLDAAKIEKELKESKEVLEKRLSLPIRHFAYPRGIVTPMAKELASRYYDSALSIFDGKNLPTCLMQMKRLPVQHSDGKWLFGPRLSGWLLPEEWVKKALGRH